MPSVKGQLSTGSKAVQDRLLSLATLSAPPNTKPTLAYVERVARLRAGTLKDCVRRASVTKTVSKRLLLAEGELGLVGLTSDWLIHGRGQAPSKRGIMPPGDLQGERSIRHNSMTKQPGTGVESQDSSAIAIDQHSRESEWGDRPPDPPGHPRTDHAEHEGGELLKLAAEAKRIAAALQEDLARSEAPVLFDGTTEKGRQQALVWALKTLARDLHVLGFDMRRMFHITDELAAEIGLPAQERHICGAAVPTGAKFCPGCGEGINS